MRLGILIFIPGNPDCIQTARASFYEETNFVTFLDRFHDIVHMKKHSFPGGQVIYKSEAFRMIEEIYNTRPGFVLC